MLTAASQFGPRARPLRTNNATATAHRVLTASGAAAVQQCQQIRDFRFGPWFSHLDSEVQEEVRRRQQAFKHKYADQLNRRLTWDKHPLADDARNAVKRMMASYWLSHDVRPCGRHVDNTEDKKERTGDNADGVRPGQSIEDVERGAMEHLIFGEDGNKGDRWAGKKRERDAKKHRQTYVPHTSYGALERDVFVIDPITNRKVVKNPDLKVPSDDAETPVRTFRAYRSRFILGSGVFNDASPPENGHETSQVEVDSSKEDANADVSSPGITNPVLGSDSNVKNHLPFDGGHGEHSQVVHPDAGVIGKSASAPRYEDLHLYEPVMHNEQAEAQDSELKYDDLHKYKPFMDDAQASSARPQKLYDDLDKYRPLMDKEAVQFEDLKPPYEDLNKYDSAVIDEMVARFEGKKAPHMDLHGHKSIFDTPASSKEGVESKYNKSVKQSDDSPMYEDLDAYKPFKHNEPHGKPPGHQVQSVKPQLQEEVQSVVEELEPGDFPASTVERLRKKYGTAELRKYTAVRHLEPDGKPSHSADERVAEQLSKGYDPEELVKYEPVYYNEPDGNPSPIADERVAEDLTKRYDPDELSKYTPVYWNEPDGQPVAAADSRVAEGLTKDYDSAELAEYEPVYWNEPDGQQPLPSVDEQVAEGLTKDYDPAELEDYERPVKWNEPDGQPPSPAEELSKKYTDLDDYGPMRQQEPDGRPSIQLDAVNEGLEEMGTRRDYGSAERIAPEELDKADEPSAEVLRKMSKRQEIEELQASERRQRLGLLLSKYQTASDVSDREAILAVKAARARIIKATEEAKAAEALARQSETPERQFTGNYVRDFPEEFDKSWTETLATAPLETNQPYDESMFESQNMDGGLEGGFGRPSPIKIQPALDRHLDETNGEIGNEQGDLKTTERKDTSYVQPPAYVKHHGGDSAPAEKETEAATPEIINHDAVGEPTLYKILAYDPTMQKIEVAETSSFVPDTASALTPADALLRLSHPTRFFPHFAPLKAEGYEIISGTGDVLVFRKVRPEVSKPAEHKPLHDQLATSTDDSEPVETRINPIDMTGRPRFSPASANFASPTGYVNYDNIPDTAASKLPPPPPKIKYNIDVHREEPVFSGPKARTSDGDKGKKKGLGKRLVLGGVWVAGVSYALGVVTEFFTTGGMDGKGPVGL
ncbi:hypothetical protein diail_661 [Diaporthe ilicicola]|nr:hypothetical protein diail_661 [Diaporthe ilicicola]